MEQKTLKANTRIETRKGAAGRLRKAGKIPAVVYGDRETFSISVDKREFEEKFPVINENEIVSLSVDGKDFEVLVKDYQENLVKGQIIHLDFFAITRGKLLRTRVPVVLEGSSPGVKDGGILEQQLHELEIECLPKNIPSKVVIDISKLMTNESIHVSQIAEMEGVRILTSEDDAVVVVTAPRGETVQAPAEAIETEAVSETE